MLAHASSGALNAEVGHTAGHNRRCMFCCCRPCQKWDSSTYTFVDKLIAGQFVHISNKMYKILGNPPNGGPKLPARV